MIRFGSSRLLGVSIAWPCVRLMLSGALKVGVNASLPLVRAVRRNFEEDVKGHKAGGNAEP